MGPLVAGLGANTKNEPTGEWRRSRGRGGTLASELIQSADLDGATVQALEFCFVLQALDPLPQGRGHLVKTDFENVRDILPQRLYPALLPALLPAFLAAFLAAQALNTCDVWHKTEKLKH